MQIKFSSAIHLLGLSLTAACSPPPEVGESAELEDAIYAENGVQFENGLNLSNGATLKNGVRLLNGLNLANGVSMSNGVLLANGLNLGNGIRLLNGVRLTNGVVLISDVNGPFIAPARGSDLEAWLAADETNNLRLIKYLVGCALPSTTTVYLQYKQQSFWLTGLAGLGPSLTKGTMTAEDQEKVSACLLARVNAARAIVSIQLYGPFAGLDKATKAEHDQFPNREACFFGNLFTPTPQPFAVVTTNTTKCNTRMCRTANGGCNCGVIDVVGTSCTGACSYGFVYNSSRYYYDCKDRNGKRWHNVATTYVK